MKKILITTVLILIILFSFTLNAMATYEKTTMEDIKATIENLDKDNNELKSITIKNSNMIEIITKDNITSNLYYNSDTNTFYSEETFDNTMDSDILDIKLENLSTLPYIGFVATAEKNNISSETSTDYVSENGLFSTLLTISLLSSSDNIIETFNEILEESKETLNIDCNYYSTKWEKEESNSKIKIKHSLTVKDNTDFSKLAENTQSIQELNNARKNADYKIYITVGETYILHLDKEITDCEFIYEDNIDYSINSKTATIKGIQIGECYGTITVAKPDTTHITQTVYIKVSAETIDNNSNNENTNPSYTGSVTPPTLEGISPKPTNTANNTVQSNTNNKVSNSTNTNNSNKVSNNTNNNSNKVTISKLPDAGINITVINIAKIVLVVSIISLILFTIYNIYQKNKKQ